MAEEEKAGEEQKVKITFEEAMKDPDFARAINSYKDSAVSKGVESYKSGNFEEAVKKAVEQRLEESKKKTPEQIKIEEMAKTMEKMKADLEKERLEKIRLNNNSLARKALDAKGFPKDLADFIIGDTEEATNEKLGKLIEILSDYEQGKKTEALKNNNIKVPESAGNLDVKVKEPGEGASKEDWKAYWKAVNQGV